MKTFYNKFKLNTNIYDITKLQELNLSKAVFFDIETTGFSAHNSVIYLIGCMYIKDDFVHCNQFLLDDNNESEIIDYFFDFIKEYQYLIHFNGEGFDIPFIKKKCELLNLNHSFDQIKSIDLYKEATKLKKLIKLDNYKQKSIELFLNINRHDKYNGGELINVYKAYRLDKDEIKLSLLLEHNLEDIRYMTALLDLYRYTALIEGQFDIKCCNISEDNCTLSIELSLYNKINSPINYSCIDYNIVAKDNKALLELPIINSELKYFYPNPKDYFYLPNEDIAIHKSVATFVDKNYREKAKATNCYIRKNSRYIPQFEAIIEPAFKESYNSTQLYAECNDKLINNQELMRTYAMHILNHCK